MLVILVRRRLDSRTRTLLLRATEKIPCRLRQTHEQGNVPRVPERLTRAHLPLEAEKIQQVARPSRRKGARHSRYQACEASTSSGHSATLALSTLCLSLLTFAGFDCSAGIEL